MTSVRLAHPSTRRRAAFLPRFVFALVGFLLLSVTAGARADDDGLCFLSGVEIERGDEPSDRGVEMEVTCAFADRQILSVDSFDLRFADGDRDLVTAGESWYEEHQAAGGSGYFSSQALNAVEVSEQGRERTVELRAHTFAIPETEAVSLEGTVDLVVESDCVGRDAREPITLAVTAGALRGGDDLPLPSGGGVVRAVEQGQHGDDPMLTLSGDGSYLGVVEPPEGVDEMTFFGTKRLVVGADADPSSTVELVVCPAEVVKLPVSIEAAAR